MAAPTTKYGDLPLATATADMDTSGERTTLLGTLDEVSTGAGNELDFGSVDITGGAADSNLKAFLWGVTSWNSNTSISNFRFWLSSNGFDDANTVVKWVHCALDPTSEWVPSAVVASYAAAPNGGWATLPEAEPSQNVYGADGSATSIASTANDSLEAIAMYVSVGASETLGTYKGTDSGYEFQFTLKYDYS